MLVFETLSAGVMAIAVGLAAVLLRVGVCAVLVWPLTFMDLAHVGAEESHSWFRTILWSVFAGGSLAGYRRFSGAAFKDRRKRPAGSPPRTVRSRR
jgi:hypothetical protein